MHVSSRDTRLLPPRLGRHLAPASRKSGSSTKCPVTRLSALRSPKPHQLRYPVQTVRCLMRSGHHQRFVQGPLLVGGCLSEIGPESCRWAIQRICFCRLTGTTSNSHNRPGAELQTNQRQCLLSDLKLPSDWIRQAGHLISALASASLKTQACVCFLRRATAPTNPRPARIMA